jgi:hypothetical protein
MQQLTDFCKKYLHAMGQNGILALTSSLCDLQRPTRRPPIVRPFRVSKSLNSRTKGRVSARHSVRGAAAKPPPFFFLEPGCHPHAVVPSARVSRGLFWTWRFP